MTSLVKESPAKAPEPLAVVTACYHCGLPIAPGTALFITVAGDRRPLCCLGCQAVALAIVANGLADYYSTRDALPESPREALPTALERIALFDHPDFQKSFVRRRGEQERETFLLLEGITCSACIWLNERHLARLPGVLAVDINYATRRARIRWDETRTKLSDILAAIAAIGYRAYPCNAANREEIARRERHDALRRLWVAGFGMMQVMMYAFPAYLAGDGEMTPDIDSLLRWASLVLTLPVVLYSATPFFRNAWRDLRLGRAGMDVPVALGIGAAFGASAWATWSHAGEVYFDTVAMFVFFLLGGRYLEMKARRKTASAIEELVKLQPDFANRLPDYPGGRQTEQVLASDLREGDKVLVRPGEIVPADGRIIEGRSLADEALLTGEGRPIAKEPGDPVTGGALNMDSPLVLQVERVGEATRLAAMVRLMEKAGLDKPPLVEMADRVAAWFVAALLLVTLAVGLAWYGAAPDRALWVSLSVLVVTCPCAFSLAAPTALAAATAALARDGLLAIRGHAIETLARAEHFVFDKTGTLTTGRMRLLETLSLRDVSPERCLQLAGALEMASEHPLAAAFRSQAAGRFLPLAEAVRSEPGCGLEARIDGCLHRIGRPDFAFALASLAPLPAPLSWLDSGDTIIALSDEAGPLALFRLGDEIRPEAKALVDALKSAGREVSLLTGDSWAAARRVSASLGIDDLRADATPEAKHAFVADLQAAGKVVAMVGDGVNDAAVLAQAQVSVAMGSGALLAKTQADFVLLSDDLGKLHDGLHRAMKTMGVIRQNLWWSFAYNFIAIPLAVAGHLPPWLAALGMSASSLLVVLNALRIQGSRKQGRYPPRPTNTEHRAGLPDPIDPPGLQPFDAAPVSQGHPGGGYRLET